MRIRRSSWRGPSARASSAGGAGMGLVRTPACRASRVGRYAGLVLLAATGCTAREGEMRYRIAGVVWSMNVERLVVETTHAGPIPFRIDGKTTYRDLQEGDVVQRVPARGNRVIVIATGEGDAAAAREVHFSPEDAGRGETDRPRTGEPGAPRFRPTRSGTAAPPGAP